MHLIINLEKKVAIKNRLTGRSDDMQSELVLILCPKSKDNHSYWLIRLLWANKLAAFVIWNSNNMINTPVPFLL